MENASRQIHEHAQQRYRLISRLRDHMSRFGYEPIELPIIEDANLFLIKAGDQIINQLFTFERHGREFSLRPEFTAAAAYHYITDKGTPGIARWQFSGPVFVDDPNDISGNYQQVSVGAELIGMGGYAAEAEIIALAVQGLDVCGVGEWRLTIGHTGLMRQVLSNFRFDIRTQRFLLHQFFALKRTSSEVLTLFDSYYAPPQAAPASVETGISGLPMTLGGRTPEEISYRLMQKRNRALERERVAEALDLLSRWRDVNGQPDVVFPMLESMISPADSASMALLHNWRKAVNLLEAYEIPLHRITIEPGLARSWEYYTGIVFELSSADIHIGGGGRYDELARLVGGQDDIPAVGFAYYVDDLLPMLPATQAQDEPVEIGFTDGTAYCAAFWAHQLRNRGIAIHLISADTATLTAESNLMIQLNGNLYTLEQIDVLIADLK